MFREHAGQRFDDHVFAASDDGWKVGVVTREVLRSDETLRAEYEWLKRRLATETDSLGEYSEGKTAFVKRVLDAAAADDALSFDFAVPSFR